MVTPAFSQAWIKADPAGTDTFLPSIVSSTSADLRPVELNDRLPDAPREGFARAAARRSCERIITIALIRMREGEPMMLRQLGWAKRGKEAGSGVCS